MDIEEIARATVISLLERDMIKHWPTMAEMDLIISDIQEIESARLEEEDYFEILEARERPF